jgi:hypothetical protein
MKGKPVTKINDGVALCRTVALALRARWHRKLSLLALSAVALSFSGCASSSTAQPQVGSITFTDATGKVINSIASVPAGTSVYLEVTVANDPEFLGANWSVSCNSELPPGTPLPPGQTVDESCGFFSPVHTVSGPVPSYGIGVPAIVTTIVAAYQPPAAQPKGGTVTLYASSTTDPSKYSSVTLAVLP